MLVDLIDPSVYPEFVLAIHSSKRLLVEQVSPPSFVLADTIINLTLAKGKRHEVSNYEVQHQTYIYIFF